MMSKMVQVQASLGMGKFGKVYRATPKLKLPGKTRRFALKMLGKVSDLPCATIYSRVPSTCGDTILALHMIYDNGVAVDFVWPRVVLQPFLDSVYGLGVSRISGRGRPFGRRSRQ